MGRINEKLARRTRGPRSHEREAELFHNSAITLVVSRDARACHQVRRKTPSSATGSAPATILTEPRTSWKSTETQVIKGFSWAGPGGWRRADPASTVPTHQPFQGGDTGPNPVGGAKSFAETQSFNRFWSNRS
jgi:hypothetical protein